MQKGAERLPFVLKKNNDQSLKNLIGVASASLR